MNGYSFSVDFLVDLFVNTVEVSKKVSVNRCDTSTAHNAVKKCEESESINMWAESCCRRALPTWAQLQGKWHVPA